MTEVPRKDASLETEILLATELFDLLDRSAEYQNDELNISRHISTSTAKIYRFSELFYADNLFGLDRIFRGSFVRVWES